MPFDPLDKSAVLVTGDIEIGAVELKDATTDTRAKVGAASGLAEGDNAVAVQAPVLGVSTAAAVVTDAAGTVQQYLRGLVKLFAAEDFATQTTLAAIQTALASIGIGTNKTPSASATAIKHLDDGAGAFINDAAFHTVDAAGDLVAGATYEVFIYCGVPGDIGNFTLLACTAAEQGVLAGTEFGMGVREGATRWCVEAGATRLRLSIRRINGAPNGYKVILARTDQVG